LVSEDSQFPESFLLIVRTERIVTTHAQTIKSACDMNEYRRILGVSSIWPTTRRIVADAEGSTHCTLWGFYLRHICYYPNRCRLFHRDRSERLGHFCLAPHVAMRVGLYLHPRPALASWGASRAVSEDPASTCSNVRARCLPLAFMPYAMRTRRSNPLGDRCSFFRIERTMTAKDSKSLFLTTKECSSKNGRTDASRFRSPSTANVHTSLFGPFGRTRPQPKTGIIASSTSRWSRCW
jgi:hypothetical protein